MLSVLHVPCVHVKQGVTWSNGKSVQQREKQLDFNVVIDANLRDLIAFQCLALVK